MVVQCCDAMAITDKSSNSTPLGRGVRPTCEMCSWHCQKSAAKLAEAFTLLSMSATCFTSLERYVMEECVIPCDVTSSM